MKISVLILTYNRPQEVIRCIKSVHDANSNDVVDEIVVVDNGSEYSNSELEKLKFVKYIKLHKNYGCPTGRNIGINNCKNELVYMLDDDGWLKNDALDIIIDEYEKISKSEKIGALVSHVILTKSSNVLGKKEQKKHTDKKVVKNFSGGASLINKKEFISAGTYSDIFWGYGEEFDISIRMRSNGNNIYKISESIMYHEPMSSVGRINETYILYNLSNVLLTVINYFPKRLCLIFFLWYLIRWGLEAFKIYRPHYIILAIFRFSLLLFKNKPQSKRIKYNDFEKILKIK